MGAGEAHMGQALRSNAGFHIPESSAPSPGQTATFQTSRDQPMGLMGSMLTKAGLASGMQKSVGVANGLQKLYEEKLLPLERDCNFHYFHQPEIPAAYFSSRPLILTVGQYSTGKTTFIEHLLGGKYPTSQIGPEPTTDRFVAICHGDQPQIIPGNVLVSDTELPFQPLENFGNGFLSKLACAKMPHPVLESVSFIDTPGVLSGEKQRLRRGYDFEEVMAWFADHSAMIILFFDAHKLDVSDEFKRTICALAPAAQKVHVILNKADKVTTQQLLRVHGALMWSLGKVMDTPEVARVYMGSFWDEAWHYDELQTLFEKEQDDLYQQIEQLPRSSTMNKINDLSKRARLCRAHALLLDYLFSQMPGKMALWGHSDKQQELIAELGRVYNEVSRAYKVPVGDFPDVNWMREKLMGIDFTKLQGLDQKKKKAVEYLLTKGIPDLLLQVPAEHRAAEAASAAFVLQRGAAGSSREASFQGSP
jgi:GTPase SAR1 family protein